MSALNALLFTLGPRGVIMHLEYTISVMAHLRATVNGRFSEMKLAMRLSVVVVAQSGGQSVAEMELASFGIKLDIQQWTLSQVECTTKWFSNKRFAPSPLCS